MHIRVYNYNTLERVHQYEAHSDYIRSIAVHPTQTFILTSSGMILSLLSLYPLLLLLQLPLSGFLRLSVVTMIDIAIAIISNIV